MHKKLPVYLTYTVLSLFLFLTLASEVSAKTITRGESATINWNVQNAPNCTGNTDYPIPSQVNGWSGRYLPGSGSETFTNLTTVGTFSFTCNYNGTIDTATLTVTDCSSGYTWNGSSCVAAGPTSCPFGQHLVNGSCVVMPSPSVVNATCNTDGNYVTLSWDDPAGHNRFYTRIADNWNGQLTSNPMWNDNFGGTSGGSWITPGLQYDFWIHSREPILGNYSDPPTHKYFTCYPPTPTPTLSQSRTPNPATVGQTMTNTWSSTNATSISASCTGAVTWSGTLPTSGTQTATYDNSWVGTTYCSWTAYGPGGQSTPWNETIVVSGSIEGSITSSGCVVPVGQSNCSASFNWTSTNATNVVVASCGYAAQNYGGQCNVPVFANYNGSPGGVWGNITPNGMYAEMRNNGVTSFATINIAATCSGGSSWNGSTCACPAGQAAISGSCQNIAPPTNVTATCNANGDYATISWADPAGYGRFYTRIAQNGANLTSNPLWNDNFGGTTGGLSVIPGASYDFWVHSRDPATGNFSVQTNKNFTCLPPAPTLTASFSPATVNVGAASTLTWTKSATALGIDIWCDSGPATARSAWEQYGITTGASKAVTSTAGMAGSTGCHARAYDNYGQHSSNVDFTWTVQAPIFGTITSPGCTVLAGQSSCSASFNWSTTNASAVSIGSCGYTLATYQGNCTGVVFSNQNVAANGSVAGTLSPTGAYAVVRNSGTDLGTVNVAATCGGGSSWNGSICACPAGQAAISGSCQNIPPPTSPLVSCNTAGTSVTVSWTAASGFNTFYTRAKVTGGANLGAPAWDDNFVGTSKTFTITPNTGYTWWVHSKDPATGNFSTDTGGNFTCTPPLPTLTATFSPYNVQAGAVSTLSWTTSNALGIDIWCDSGPAAARSAWEQFGITSGTSKAVSSTEAMVGTTGCHAHAYDNYGQHSTRFDFTWGVSSAVCPNGATNPPTCTTCASGQVMYAGSCATPSATITAPNCTIAIGASTCTSNLSWTASNITSPVFGGCGYTAQNYGGNCTQGVGFANQTTPGNISATISGNGAYLRVTDNTGTPTYREVTLIGNCQSGSTWNGSTCAANTCPNGATNPPACTTCPGGQVMYAGSCAVPTGTISSPGCTIPVGASSCQATFTWSSTNSSSVTVGSCGYTGAGYTGNCNVVVFADQSGASGSVAGTLTTNGAYAVIRNNGVDLNSTTVAATCASGSAWNGSTCASTAATASITPGTCTIPAGGTSCQAAMSWTSSNLTSPTFAGCGYANQNYGGQCNVTTFATQSGASGSVSATLTGNGMYMTVNGNPSNTSYANTTAVATCGGGSYWSGNVSPQFTCVCPSGQTPSGGTCVPLSASITAPNCTIAIGASSCQSTLTWTSSGVDSPTFGSCGYSSPNYTGTCNDQTPFNNQNTASGSVVGTISGNGVYVRVAGNPGNMTYAETTLIGICATDSTWDGTICRANTCANGATNYSTCTVCPAGQGMIAGTCGTLPPPTNPIASCDSSGTSATFSWTAPAGHTLFYTRASTGGVNLNAPAWDDNFTGTSKTFTTTPGNTYTWWVHTKDAVSGNWSTDTGGTFTCIIPPAVASAVVNINDCVNPDITLSCSNSDSYEVRNTDTNTLVSSANATSAVVPLVDEGNYSIACKMGALSSPLTIRAYTTSSCTPRDLSAIISPRTIRQGGSITLTWSITYPNNSCTLSAKAVCPNGASSCPGPREDAATALNTRLTTENTDANDPNGSRPIQTAVRTKIGSTTRAAGKKTLQVNYTTDFILRCTAVPDSKTRVQVTTENEG